MADSFENVKHRAEEAAQGVAQDHSGLLRKLDPRQRKALNLFREHETITSRDVVKLFGFSERTARALLSTWVESGFVAVADPAKKSRKYSLAAKFKRAVLT